MFILAESYARFEETVPEETLDAAATELHELAERVLRELYGERYDILRVRVVVRIEIGSCRVWITISCLVTVLTSYGNIRQSVDYLVRDAKTLGTIILPEVGPSLRISERPQHHQRRTGVPGRIRALFREVERGTMSADEATTKALSLLYDFSDSNSGHLIPEFAEELSRSLRKAKHGDCRSIRVNRSFRHRQLRYRQRYRPVGGAALLRAAIP